MDNIIGFVSQDSIQLAFRVTGTYKGVFLKYEVIVFLCQLFFSSRNLNQGHNPAFQGQWDFPQSLSHQEVPTHPDIWACWRRQLAVVPEDDCCSLSPIVPLCNAILPPPARRQSLDFHSLQSGRAPWLLWEDRRKCRCLQEASCHMRSMTALRPLCYEKPKPCGKGTRSLRLLALVGSPSWGHSQRPLPTPRRSHLEHPAQRSLSTAITPAGIPVQVRERPLAGAVWLNSVHPQKHEIIACYFKAPHFVAVC